jgi:hypothetical protein
MTALEIKHPWQEIQSAHGVEITAVNPLELGRPFQLTEAQRIALQPYLTHAGKGGAVLIVATYSEFENWLTARPLAVNAQQRKSISASLTRIKKQNP